MAADSTKSALPSLGLILAIALLLIAVGVSVWWLSPQEFGRGDNTISAMVVQIRSWGHWAVVGSIALMLAHSFLPFPPEIITLANGMVFGPLSGSVITWVGAMLGAISTFGLVRLLGIVAVFAWILTRRRAKARTGK